MATREYAVRDGILDALNSVYAPQHEGKDWYQVKYLANASYITDVNMQLTTDILALYVYAHIDPDHDHVAKHYGDTLYGMIRNMIWTVHPGGTTAEFAAKKVCEVLHVKIDADV